MHIYCLQHVHFEGPGVIAAWAAENGHSFYDVKLFNDESLPDSEMVDMLIIMGGPMSFDEDDKHPCLQSEKQLIRDIISQSKPVLGICLGAQLIAEAIDGSGKRGTGLQEIGWFPVQFQDKNLLPKGLHFFPEVATVFHWHGDTFEIPGGAIRLASSDPFPNQGFIYHDNVIGLQFHLEVTTTTLKEMAHHGMQDLIEDRYVQSAEQILQQTDHLANNRKMMYDILDYLSSAKNITE